MLAQPLYGFAHGLTQFVNWQSQFAHRHAQFANWHLPWPWPMLAQPLPLGWFPADSAHLCLQHVGVAGLIV